MLLIVERYLNCARDKVRRIAESGVESKIGREVQIVSEIKCKTTSLIINIIGSYEINT